MEPKKRRHKNQYPTVTAQEQAVFRRLYTDQYRSDAVLMGNALDVGASTVRKMLYVDRPGFSRKVLDRILALVEAAPAEPPAPNGLDFSAFLPKPVEVGPTLESEYKRGKRDGAAEERKWIVDMISSTSCEQSDRLLSLLSDVSEATRQLVAHIEGAVLTGEGPLYLPKD